MEKHNIGDQWEGLVGGRKHLFKLVPHLIMKVSGVDFTVKKSDPCFGCILADACGTTRLDDGEECGGHQGFVIDLGELDENGLLSCPVPTDVKPQLIVAEKEGLADHWVVLCKIVREGKTLGVIYVEGKTRQEAIDNWNRRK